MRPYKKLSMRQVILLQRVGKKIASLNLTQDRLIQLKDEVSTLYRMLLAYKKKEYTNMPWKSMGLIIGALTYFVIPTDAMPDFIPISGLLDDLSVIAYVVSSVRKDIDQFLAWEMEHYIVE